MQNALNRYFEDIDICVDEDAYSKAWQKVKAMVSQPLDNLEPLSFHEASTRMPTDTSPGYPYTKLGFTKKRDAMRVMRSDAKFMYVNSRKKLFYPCIASSRRVIRKRPSNKPRLVWVYPGSITLMEARYAIPVIDYLKEKSFMGWSVNWLSNGRWKDKFKALSIPAARLSLDFSSFDSKVSARFIRDAFDLIKNLFDLTEDDSVNFSALVDYFVHTPIAFYGDVVQKHRGIPSGSYFTQIIGTLVNMFYCMYAEERLQGLISILPQYSMWLGDDSYLCLTEGRAKDEVDIMLTTAFSGLGCELNADKCKYYIASSWYEDDRLHPYGTFLSREIIDGPPGLCFDYDKFVAQVFIPEDVDKTPGHTKARLIGLAWAYGFNRQAYALLSRCWSRLSKSAPIEWNSRFLNSMSYLVDLTLVDTSSFPDYEIIAWRYMGVNPPLNQSWSPGGFDLPVSIRLSTVNT